MADYIEEMQKEAKLRFGKELSVEEVANEFAKHGFEARIFHLKTLEESGDAINGSSDEAMRKAAKRKAFERVLYNVHNKLRSIQR